MGNGSCHPSSSSQDDCEIVGTQPAKELVPGETPIQRQENQDYIKAEPVSPVRRYFPPRISVDSPDEPRTEATPGRQAGNVEGTAHGRYFPPRISVESPDEPRTEATPGRQAGNVEGTAQGARVSPVVSNHQGNDPVVSRANRMLNRSTTIALSPTEKGDSENELALARPVQPSFTSYIIRQSSFEGGDDSGLSAGSPPDGNERARPQEPGPGASVDPRMQSQNSPIYKPRQGLGGRLMTIRRQESIEEGRYGQMDARESEESPATAANRPTAEVPPVTQSETRNRSHRLTFKEMANQMLENTEKRSLDPSTPLSLDLGNGAFPGMAGLQRAGRPRSFSISEGDTRALYSGLNSEYPAMAAVRVPGATAERERPPYGLHIQPGWHPYPGLGYQSLSVDAGASKYWNFPSQGPRALTPQEEGSSQAGAQGEESRDQNGSMEGSVLYKALQSNEGSKQHRRNSNNAGNVPEGGPRPNQSWQHPWAKRRGLSEMAQRMPWNQSSHPFPLLNHREHSVESLPPSSQRNGSDNQQVFHHKRFRSMERSASEGHNSTANPHRKVGGQGISSESSQDLAQADDITRQVQQVMEGTNTLYSSRDKSGVPIWTEEQHSPHGGSTDSNDKDSDLRRRSRKSTFNIYREIPERKRKLDRDEEEKIKHSYNPDGSFDYFTLTGWKAYKCDLCKKRRFKTASELEDHKRRKHGSLDISPYSTSAGSPSNVTSSANSVANTSSSSVTTNTTAGMSNGTTTTMATTSATTSPKPATSENSSDSNKTGEESKSTGASSG